MLSQAVQIGIIASMGGVSLLFLGMTATCSIENIEKKNKKETKEKSKKINIKARKRSEAEPGINELPFEVSEELEFTLSEEKGRDTNKPVLNETGEPPFEYATLSVIQRGPNEDEHLNYTIIDNAIIEKGEYKIGCKKSSDYMIGNKYVSGTHVILSKHDGKYFIMDVSRNGTSISALPYRKAGQNAMLYKLEVGKEEELLDHTIISLAGQVELLFTIKKK